MMTWLEALVAAKGSDLHLKVGSPPRMRVDGRLVVLDGPHLTPDTAEELLRDLIRPDLHQQFQKTNEADFAYSLPGVGRFWVNAFRQRGSVGMVLRRVQEGAMSIGELGLPTTSPSPCGPPCARTPTSSWSARSATPRPSRPPWPPPRPSTAASTCSRPTSSATCACRWPPPCAASSASAWSAGPATAAAWPSSRSWSTPAAPPRPSPTPSAPATSPRSWPRAASTACRPSTSTSSPSTATA
jgi:hypothetical protein